MALHKMVTVGLLLASLLGMAFGKIAECSEGWQSNNDSCWKVYDADEDAVTWMDAKLACRKENGELASINSDVEQKFVIKLIGSTMLKCSNLVWIGLAACESWNEESHRWLYKNQLLTYNKYDSNQPDDKGKNKELCVLIDNKKEGGSWHSYPCSHRAHYVCRKPVQSKVCARRS